MIKKKRKCYTWNSSIFWIEKETNIEFTVKCLHLNNILMKDFLKVNWSLLIRETVASLILLQFYVLQDTTKSCVCKCELRLSWISFYVLLNLCTLVYVLNIFS